MKAPNPGTFGWQAFSSTVQRIAKRSYPLPASSIVRQLARRSVLKPGRRDWLRGRCNGRFPIPKFTYSTQPT
jgi:hypothetical protein